MIGIPFTISAAYLFHDTSTQLGRNIGLFLLALSVVLGIVVIVSFLSTRILVKQIRK